MQEIDLRIDHASGLHLRPASLFVQTAASFQSDVQVRNVTKESDYQNAKSAIGLMMLKVSQGDTINIRAEGDDEAEAIAGLQTLINNDFEG